MAAEICRVSTIPYQEWWKMTSQVVLSKCPICDKEGIKQIVERLPKDGLFMRLTHLDGSVHDWGEYYSNDHKETRDPKRIHCPKCGKLGIVNSWNPDAKQPWIIKYYVRHGKIKYGKGNSRSQDRCMIEDSAQRDQILKKLGRYISQ
jgi:hypothetical protein